MSRQPKLTIVEVVTQENGKTFYEEWRENSLGSEVMVRTFEATGLVLWPDDPRAQGRHQDIEDEITLRFFEELRAVAEETFVRIASEVLARERRKG